MCTMSNVIKYSNVEERKANDRDCNIRLRIHIIFQLFTQVSNLCKSIFVLVCKNKKNGSDIGCLFSVRSERRHA